MVVMAVQLPIIMSSYIIAGSADNPDTAACEEIANLIKSCYSNIDFRVVIKHPSEWDQHISEICKTYGFRKKHNPIAYTFDGKIIGGKKDFQLLCQKYFGIEPKRLNKINQHINSEIAARELQAKLKTAKKKLTLDEKIIEAAKAKLKQRLIKAVTGIFSPCIDDGVLYHVKLEERLAPTPSYKFSRQNDPVNQSVHESAIDIEELARRDQLVQANMVAEQIEQVKQLKKQPSEHSAIQGPEQGKEQEGDDSKQKRQGQDQSIVQLQQVLVSAKGSDKHDSQHSRKGGMALQQNSSSTFDLINLTDLVIKPFKDDFYLAFHPEPIIDGHLILFHKSQFDTTLFEVNDQTSVFIKDYSRYRRSHKTHFVAPLADKKEDQGGIKQEVSAIEHHHGHQEQSKNVSKQMADKRESFVSDLFLQPNEAKLSRPFINIRRILSEMQWNKIVKLLVKTDSIVTLQILPAQAKSHLPLSTGIINVYPRSLITEAHRSIGLTGILGSLGAKGRTPGQLIDMENNILALANGPAKEIIHLADGHTAYSFPELVFNHLVATTILPERTGKGYQSTFNAMCTYLADHFQGVPSSASSSPSIGINMLVCNSFLMAAPITSCYDHFNGQPIHLHESCLLGLLSLPKFKTCWENRILNRERRPRQCMQSISPRGQPHPRSHHQP